VRRRLAARAAQLLHLAAQLRQLLPKLAQHAGQLAHGRSGSSIRSPVVRSGVGTGAGASSGFGAGPLGISAGSLGGLALYLDLRALKVAHQLVRLLAHARGGQVFDGFTQVAHLLLGRIGLP
jgi:hypothetical protein